MIWFLSTSYRKSPSFFFFLFSNENRLSSVLEGGQKWEKQFWFYFKNVNGVFPSNSSTSWEKSQMRAGGPCSASRGRGSRVPGLRRRAAWPGAAGWYSPWGCQHLLQIHSARSESARKEEERTRLLLSGKATKEAENTYTDIVGEGACSLALFSEGPVLADS